MTMPPDPPAPPTQVRVYEGRTEAEARTTYAADALRMQAAGWLPTTEAWEPGRSGTGRDLLLGYVGRRIFKPNGKLTVTYRYQPPAAPSGSPPPTPPPLVSG